MWPKRKKSEPKTLPPAEDPSSLGNIFIEHGLVTHEQFAGLLAEFQNMKVEMLIGQFLVSQTIITQEELDLMLLKQDRMRKGGGTTHASLMKIMDIAQRTQEATGDEVRELNVVMLKVNGNEG